MSGFRAGLYAYYPKFMVISSDQPQLICCVCLTDIENCFEIYLFVTSSSDIADRLWPWELIALLALTSICLNP